MEVGKTGPEIAKPLNRKKALSPEQELKEKIKRSLVRNRKIVGKEERAEIEFLLKRL